MLHALGEDAAAIAAYAAALKLHPDHARAPWAQYHTGVAWRRLGERQKALGVFTALVQQAQATPGELWEPLARQHQRDLETQINYRNYLAQ